MKRKYRILRIWYFGKTKLAKKIRRRIFMDKMLEKCKYFSRNNRYIKAKDYANTLNKVQLSYVKELLNKHE